MSFNRIPLKHRHLWGDRRATLLIADSDPDVVHSLIQMTPPDLFRIQEVSDPADLCERLRWFDVVMVVVDVDILKRNKNLRDHLEFRSRLGVPVIVTGSGLDPADEALARGLGCVLYAPKPCGHWMLHEAVKGLLCQGASGPSQS